MADFNDLNEQGLADRGDILGDQWEAPAPTEPFIPPTLEGAPAFPEPGIYFGMSDEEYHAIHALSTSGIKHLSISSMDYWANSVLNPDRDLDEDGNEKIEKPHFNFGKAIHCFVLEGEDCYRARYVVGLDKADYKDALETTDQIKARIVQLGAKPTTKGYDDITRSAKKEDWIAQLLDLDPEAVIWDRVKADFAAEHEGAQFVTAHTDRRVRIAARMILAHPEISKSLSGGFPEVSVFWYCPVTGCPMKARFDYLTLTRIVDLKSFSNRGGMPIDRAIERTIASYRYNVQHAVYIEAAGAVKALIRERGNQCVFNINGEDFDGQIAFALEWADQPAPPDFLFVFQQTGVAPVTRGKLMPTEGMGVFGTTSRRVEELKRTFIANCEVYGTDPWVDFQPITMIEDEAIPMWATEI